MAQNRKLPRVYIIAGPNGAGKTTFAKRFLPEYAHCPHFVNADYIAAGLSPFSPGAANMEAGRLMLKRIHTLMLQKADFGFETTLATKTLAWRLNTLKKNSYQIHLFYLWVHSPLIALQRIAGRVQNGGHDVAEETVRRRFQKSLCYLLDTYLPLSDTWIIFNNSGDTPVCVAFGDRSGVHIENKEAYEDVLGMKNKTWQKTQNQKQAQKDWQNWLSLP